MKKSLPILSLFSAVAMIISIPVSLVFTDTNEHVGSILVPIVGLVSSTVPSLIAAAYSERASKDIRNGVVQEKARKGALKALDETGVTEVVANSQRGESSVLAMNALARLLEASNRNNPPSEDQGNEHP